MRVPDHRGGEGEGEAQEGEGEGEGESGAEGEGELDDQPMPALTDFAAASMFLALLVSGVCLARSRKALHGKN